MDSLLTVIGPIIGVGALYVVAPVVADAYRRFRGTKTVICPETNQPAEIQLDAAEAAASAAVGSPHLQVARCSRWPARHYCGHECVEQLK